VRVYLPLLISVLTGAVVAGLLFLLPLRQEEGRTPAPPQETPEGVAPTDPAMRARLAADALADGRAQLAAGRLREAQDRFVEVLLLLPGHEQAWAGLIQVRRRLANDDAALLRRQAAAYQSAIAKGTETEEHYAAPAMALLAEASLRAAREVERGPTPIVLGSRPQARVTPRAVATARPSPPPSQRPRPRATRRRAAVTPAPSPPASPAARPRLYLLRAGPLVSPAHVAEVAAALDNARYAWRLDAVDGTPYYFMTLGPHPRSVTDAIVRFLAARFPELTVAVGAVP